MIKYKTSVMTLRIEKVEVESETKHYVTLVGEGRCRKISPDYHCYFDTFKEAKQYLDKSILGKLKILDKQRDVLTEKLHKVSLLKEELT